MKKTKNNNKLIKNIDTSKIYEPIDAIKILKENSYTKFEEVLEVAINLGIDSNKTDQNIRGITNLPKGTGKKSRLKNIVVSGKTGTVQVVRMKPDEYLTVLLTMKYKEVFKREYHRL